MTPGRGGRPATPVDGTRNPWALGRRELISGILASSVASPGCAQVATPASPAFTPEAFGAAGDGRSDDFAAFQRMVGAVNAGGGGRVRLRGGSTYLLDRYVVPGNGVADLTFDRCDGLIVDGEGAVISARGDFRRDQEATRGLMGLLFRDCRNVTVRNLELDGNVDRTVRTLPFPEAPAHGLTFQSCSEVTIEGVFVHHFAADGLYIRNSKRRDSSGATRASRHFTVRNSRFMFNARQGLSIIQLRGGLFENCDFSYTGYVDRSGARGPYGAHSPSAGVDVEPNRTPRSPDPIDVLTGEIRFRGCRMIGNGGAAFVAAKYAAGHAFLERVVLESCELECNQGEGGGQDGFIFDVPDGLVAGCRLQMFDKTAYLGWYPSSGASPEFRGNSVYGRNPKPHRPLFAARPTRGAPLISGNRFIGQHRQPKPTSDSWLLLIDNPNATVRGNHLFVPAAAFPRHGKMVPAVLASARLLEGNIYETDLDGSELSQSSFFGVLYSNGSLVRGEVFRGTLPGRRDAVRPVDGATRKPLEHDDAGSFTR